MGEPTFTRPLTKWLEKRRAKKQARLERATEDAELEAVRETFHLEGPAKAQAPQKTPAPATEVAPEEVVPPASQQAETETDQLPLDLRDNVFSRRSRPPEEPTPEEPGTSEPAVRPIGQVRIEPSPEEEEAGQHRACYPGGGAPPIRPRSGQ